MFCFDVPNVHGIIVLKISFGTPFGSRAPLVFNTRIFSRLSLRADCFFSLLSGQGRDGAEKTRLS